MDVRWRCNRAVTRPRGPLSRGLELWEKDRLLHRSVTNIGLSGVDDQPISSQECTLCRPGSASTLARRTLAARVAELADAQDLGSCGETRGGSTPPSRNSSPWQKGTGSEPMALGATENGISRGACPLLPRAPIGSEGVIARHKVDTAIASAVDARRPEKTTRSLLPCRLRLVRCGGRFGGLVPRGRLFTLAVDARCVPRPANDIDHALAEQRRDLLAELLIRM